jgi:serine/threonine protein kinase
MALEYCAGNICDLILKKDIPEVHLLNRQLSHPQIFTQIINGIQHLHSLNIVHRDIKPQNILISTAVGKKLPRILISDFGLGKMLADDQSSFHNTIVPGGGPAGTSGWRAPECLLANRDSVNEQGWNDNTGKPIVTNGPKIRITKSIDIFSTGCVYYYIASAGNHPFGDSFTREMNIIKGNYRLTSVDNCRDSFLLKDLLKNMIAKDATKR